MAGAAADPAVQQLQEQASVARQQIGRMAESFDGLRAAHELLKTTSAQAEALAQSKIADLETRISKLLFT